MNRFRSAKAMPPYNAAKLGYTALWSGMKIRPDKLLEVESIAAKLYRNKLVYQEVETATGVPWFVIALIDQMEGGGNANTHLHNGDSLSARTVNVPSGRPPPPAEPPFSFQQSCKDALAYDGLDKITDWSIERLGYELEKYNGSGYYAVDVNSPYLWSFSNEYSSGKYVSDGVFDPNAVSGQAGAMPILYQLMKLDPSIFGTAVPVQPSPPIIPTPIPVPHPPAPSPAAPSLLGLSLAQWASILASDPAIMSDVAKLTPDALALITRINTALQGTHS